ncbi:hypothetical protein ACIRQP_23235 [Streptomyces sp. NPDC102274]|uniref:hypothetical protein n=1 Tax=Streptomyces sp. NPDC102274 TaxID=3366151 RepID=UPI00382F0EB2
MRDAKRMSPLGAIATGLVAGAVGTGCMDTVRFLRQRRTGGEHNVWKWEFAPVRGWQDAPSPGQVGKRVIEGFTRRELPDSSAWLVSTLMHWSYGSAWGAMYGVLVGSLRTSRADYGAPFGAVVWISGYALLSEAGLYKPIWEYDRKTLAEDLTGHLAYGVGTGAAFWVLRNFVHE